MSELGGAGRFQFASRGKLERSLRSSRAFSRENAPLASIDTNKSMSKSNHNKYNKMRPRKPTMGLLEDHSRIFVKCRLERSPQVVSNMEKWINLIVLMYNFFKIIHKNYRREKYLDLKISNDTIPQVNLSYISKFQVLYSVLNFSQVALRQNCVFVV